MPDNGIRILTVPLFNGGYTGTGNGNLQIPQGTTPEETRQYLKENYPETYDYFEAMGNDYSARQLSPEESERLMNTEVGSAQSQTVKKFAEKAIKTPFFKRCWKNIKNFFKKLIKGDEKAQKQIADTYNCVQKAKQATDLYNQFNNPSQQQTLYA